jgi:hypothetical protein
MAAQLVIQLRVPRLVPAPVLVRPSMKALDLLKTPSRGLTQVEPARTLVVPGKNLNGFCRERRPVLAAMEQISTPPAKTEQQPVLATS